jgi:hypothetical protein
MAGVSWNAMPAVRAVQIALRPAHRITVTAARSSMAQHEMQVQVDKHARQKWWGSWSSARLVCSCGYESPWEASRGEGLAEDHRRQVVEDALGLTFVTKQPAHVGR